jgi:hypothetical protein
MSKDEERPATYNRDSVVLVTVPIADDPELTQKIAAAAQQHFAKPAAPASATKSGAGA